MTTIKLFGGDLGSETMLVRCDLTQAAAPVEVDYGTADGWESTQYQCADCRHVTDGLATIGRALAAVAVAVEDNEFNCECEVVT